MSVSDLTGTKTKPRSKPKPKLRKGPNRVIVGGRKPTYSDETKTKVLGLLRDGATMFDIESTAGLPDWNTIQSWRYDSSGARTAFDQQFQKAIKFRAERWADRCIRETRALPLASTHEMINRQRLMNGIVMWHNAKFDADRFGDKPTTSVQVGIALALTEDQRDQLLQRRERALLAR